MSRLLLRTAAAVEDCERHLAATGASGTEIESYLTQYLVVLLCAEVQQELYRLTENRASLSNDVAVSSFVVASTRKVLRSVGKKEIASFVEMFGPECKSKLNSRVDDAEVTLYSNAVGNRHDVAHNQGSQISLRELKAAVNAAEKILEAAAHAIA